MLETERLILRKWKAEDTEPMTQINQDPAVMEFFPEIGTPESTQKLIDHINQHFEKHGYGLFACEIKESREFIGFVGLNIPSFKAHFTPAVEIGWRLGAPFWGKGYAPEAAKEVLQFGFKTLNLSEIVSFTAEQNLRSRRVMEKIGLKHNPKDDFNHPNLPLDHPLNFHVLYRLKNSEY